MKKYLVIGGAALVLLGGATLKTGSTYESESRRALDQALSDPTLELVSHEIDSGFWGSRQVFVVAMDLGYGDRLLLSSTNAARYLPGWVKFAGGLEIEMEEASGKVLSINEFLNQPAFPYQGTANWRGAQFSFDLPDIDIHEEGVEVTLRDLNLEVNYRFGGVTRLQMGVGAMDVAESWSEDGLQLRRLSVAAEQEGTYPWVRSRLTMGLESLDFVDQSGWNSTSFNVAGLTLQQEMHLTPAALDYALQLNQDSLVMNDAFLLNDLVVRLHTDNIPGEPVAQLLEALVNETRGERHPADEENTIRSVTQLLAASPALVVDQLRFQAAVMGDDISETLSGRFGFDGEALESSLVESVLFDLGLRDQRYENEQAFFARLQLRAELQELNAHTFGGLLPIPPHYFAAEGPQVFVLERGEFTLNGQALGF